MGRNAALWAHGTPPEPVIVPTDGQALGARFHTEVALIHAIETGLTDPGRAPQEMHITYEDKGCKA